MRLFHPRPVAYLGIVIVASLVGFLGNEAVAIFRIRVGREIGSAALVADGYHARVDGWTSLAVLAGCLWGPGLGTRWPTQSLACSSLQLSCSSSGRRAEWSSSERRMGSIPRSSSSSGMRRNVPGVQAVTGGTRVGWVIACGLS